MIVGEGRLAHSRTRIGGRRALAVCVLTLGAIGCWLPIRYREAGSPMLVGHLWRSDGAPAAGARVAVTSDWRDATCDHAIAWGATDSVGVFRLQPTIVERRGILLIPPIEHFSTPYYVCVGAPNDSVVRMAYGGSIPISRELVATRDSLTCLEWVWEGRSRITCSEPGGTALQAGGSWREGASAGYYRLIMGTNGEYHRPRSVFLQWVQHADSGGPQAIRATVAVPLPARLVDLQVEKLALSSGGVVCVTIRTTTKPHQLFFRDLTREEIALELGPPGQVRRVPSCVGREPSTGGAKQRGSHLGAVESGRVQAKVG